MYVQRDKDTRRRYKRRTTLFVEQQCLLQPIRHDVNASSYTVQDNGSFSLLY